MRKFAVSDIHGCAKSLQFLVEQKLKLKSSDDLYLLGDYIDRGPDSKGVLDYIMDLRAQGMQVHCLMGNHEEMALAARSDEQMERLWYLNGGRATLRSFGAEEVWQIPDRYWRFMESLDLFYEVDRYILVHAGFNFQNGNPFSDQKAMLWARRWEKYLDFDWLGDRYIVHGHTPIHRRYIEKGLRDLNRSRVMDIDGGCVFLGEQGMGRLYALEMTSRKLMYCHNQDEGL